MAEPADMNADIHDEILWVELVWEAIFVVGGEVAKHRLVVGSRPEDE